MHRITADEFTKIIYRDPAWAAKLTEPVEIVGFCDMDGSEISHLSPLLHFLGEIEISETDEIGGYLCGEQGGYVASFEHCENLKVAEGTFHGRVSFEHSRIEKIDPERLIILKSNNDGPAAGFRWCEHLKVAEGKFPGGLNFAGCPIEKVGNLILTGPDENEVIFSPQSPDKRLEKTPLAVLEKLSRMNTAGINPRAEIARRDAQKRMKQPDIQL